MLDIFLFETDADISKSICDICTEYAIRSNSPAAFKAFSEIPESICADGVFGREAALYLVKGCERCISLAESIRRLNFQNYIILLADGLSDILNYTSAGLRPAGILMKPVKYEAAERIFNDISAYLKKSRADLREQFRFKIRAREYTVPQDAILYFEAVNKKMTLRTAGQVFEFYMPSEEVLKQLLPRFVRIHKSFIVNVGHISVADYKNMTVELDDGSVIYISRTYKVNLQTALAELANEKCDLR